MLLIKELSLLRVLQLIDDCDEVNASSADSETVFLTAPRGTLLPKGLAPPPSLPPPGGPIPQDEASMAPPLDAPPPPHATSHQMPCSVFSEGLPSRAEAVLHFLSELIA